MTKTNKPKSLRELFLYLEENPTVYVDKKEGIELTFKRKDGGILIFEDDNSKHWHLRLGSDGVGTEPKEPDIRFFKDKFTNVIGKEKTHFVYST